MTGTLTVLDPSERPTCATTSLHPRPASIAGATIGVLDNGKPNSDRLLAALHPALMAHGATDIVTLRKPSIGRLAPTEILDDLAARCDLVVTGVGDCAGCCSCTVQDAIALEGRGRPTFVICTTEFLTTAQIAATSGGAPDYDFTVVDHPLGSLTNEQLAVRAESAATQILSGIHR